MEISLKEFKERYLKGLLEIHWKQWSALGVVSHVEPEKNWIIDLEALVLSTFILGLKDTRLLHASVEWLIKNSKWLFLQRFKRIARVFKDSPLELGSRAVPLLDDAGFQLLGEALRREGGKGWRKEWGREQVTGKSEYEALLKRVRIRGIVTEPVVQKPSLLQLRFRGVFGVDAKADVFLYLLTHEGGNSNSIARETFLNQRNLYELLERWYKGGILTKIRGRKAITFVLERKEMWLKVLGLKEIPVYLNWVNTFHLLDKISKVLSLPPWSEDEYLVSSFFRDILEETKILGQALGISLPDPFSYPGTSYFSPFAGRILEIMDYLKEGSLPKQ